METNLKPEFPTWKPRFPKAQICNQVLQIYLHRRWHHLRTTSLGGGTTSLGGGTTSLRGRLHPFMEAKVSKMIQNGNHGFQNDPKWKLRFPK